MFRKSVLVLALIAMTATAAFAQLTVGVSGSLYSDENLTSRQVFERFRNGDGIFYGPLIEIGMDRLAIGASGNFSFFMYDYFGDGLLYPMQEYDLNLYLQGHLFEYDSFLDPFVEIGIGTMGFDFRTAGDFVDPDEENPLQGSKYWHAGGGLGINLGDLGIFIKGLYTFDLGAVETTYWQQDVATDKWSETPTPILSKAYPLRRLKILLGVKFMLN